MKKHYTLFFIFLLSQLVITPVYKAQSNWEAITWENITSSDEIIVTMTTQNGAGTTYALPNDGGTTTPIAVRTTQNGSTIEFENGYTEEQLIWNIDIANGKLYPDKTTAKWLYTTKSNNGVRIGTNTTNGHVWAIDGGYLKTNDGQDDRWLGIYSPTNGAPSWRAYKNTTSTIAGQAIAFYKKTIAAPDTVAMPICYPESGSYEAPLYVELSCSTDQAVIRYTINGGTPDENSMVYSVPILLSENTTLLAKAWKDGMIPSQVSMANYTIAAPNLVFHKIPQHSAVTPDDTYMIVDIASGYALSSANGSSSAPPAIAVNIQGDSICSTPDNNLLWNFHSNPEGYVISPQSDSTKWLYTTNSSNNGVRIGTNANKFWILDIEDAPNSSYHGFQNSSTLRYLGVYNHQDWRSYTSINSQIENTQIKIFILGEAPIVDTTAAPIFTPDGGQYLFEQTVDISCATPGATIYYTTDGSHPTMASSIYNAPIPVTSTTTLKAMAKAENSSNSAITTAIYVIPELFPIAQARAIENGSAVCVEGVVTFIDHDDIYIQDTSAAIVLRTNANTIPSTLAIGDKIRSFGTKQVANGLVILNGIDASSTNSLSVVGHGYPLPLVLKSIAAINSDYLYNNQLQASRVKIEHAIIGVINNNGVTTVSQGPDSLNVFQIPHVEGLEAGDDVTVTGVIGCDITPQLLIQDANDVSYTHIPKITVTPSSIAGIQYYFNHGPSEVVYFYLAGRHLNGGVSIFPSEHFEVSTFAGPIFRPENPAIVFPPSSGSFANIKIYARLKAGLPIGAYHDTLSIVSHNADTVFLPISGNVIDGSLMEDKYVRVSNLNNLQSGRHVIITARYDEDTTQYCALSNALINGKLNGISFVSEFVGNAEILPAHITDDETDYMWTLHQTEGHYTFTNSNGDRIGYGNGANFTMNNASTTWDIGKGTSSNTSMVPDYESFTITNVNTVNRAFALNGSHSCGPYATSNMTSSGYNFFIDFFVKNEANVIPIVASPAIDPGSGTYYETQTVNISCTTPDATIHYTLNGENPSETSPVYTQPLTIDTNTVLKAIACKPEWQNSAISTAHYSFIEGYVIVFNQDWEDGMKGWSFVDVIGEAQWSIEDDGGHYAGIYGADAGENEDWCISPAFDLSAYDNVKFSFRSAKSHTGTNLKVLFSNDYDGVNPSNATWTPLCATLSSGGWNWTDSGEIDLGEHSETNCHIGFKYTCSASNVSAWGVDDCLLVAQEADPSIAVFPTDLSGFNYVVGQGPSETQQFNVSGSRLSSGVSISGTSHYEISLESGDNFSAEPVITLPVIDGNLTPTPIYVRLESGLDIGQYSGEAIMVAAENADSVCVVCNGEVIETSSTDNWRRIASLNQLADGDRVIFAARYDAGSSSAYSVMTATPSGKPEGVLCNTTAVSGDMILPDAIANQANDFYWNVHFSDNAFVFTNAENDTIGYSGSGTNFMNGGSNCFWNIERSTSNGNAMIPDFTAFNIINTAFNRGVAMNSNHDFGAYSTSNMNGSNYNFFIDIFVQSEPVTSITATPDHISGLEYVEGQGPSNVQRYHLNAANLMGNGDVSVATDSVFEVSLDSINFSTNIALPYENGILTNQPVVIFTRLKSELDAGIYNGTITHEGGGGNCAVNLTGEVIADNNPIIAEAILPLYIQGNNGTNNKRLPYAYRLKLTKLQPNSTYRYINQMVDSNDDTNATGVGNVIFINGDIFFRTTNPSFESEGNYGVFTTDAEGNYAGWFISESTGNSRFTPGNQIFMRIRLNDGNEGNTAVHFLTSNDYATVINFGKTQNELEGSAVMGVSDNSPKDFVFLYDNITGEGRPLYGTSIETTGIDFANINQYVAFFRNDVAGNNGYWGAIIPNINDHGVRYIEVRDLLDGEPVDSYSSDDGTWGNYNTVNPSGGTNNIIVINLNGMDVDHQEEEQISICSNKYEIRITNSSQDDFKMTVYNLLGQIMISQYIYNSSCLSIPHRLNAGLFIVTLSNGKTSISKKIIIE